ncbi:proton-conducting transporter transmembrane domain-containing protein [Anaeromyxobacter terrae]|uniref:proton-conducting transporter transmembrane domain-containing protein n=1 Tax=Anaeromyxobacter terrae TaxID=2925406 RepID=UPI001F57CCD9|nr:proton-conducting transporter membrane subunit [Anaeromyxobacter sp. SG22]
MSLYLAALVLLGAGGLAALAASARPSAALAIGSASAAVGSALGLIAAFPALRAPPAAWELAWAVPNGALALGLDPLSAVFAVAVFALGLAAAVFGAGYMRAHLARRSLGAFLFFFNVLLASMALLVAARQALLFIVAWETMTVSSALLVGLEHEDGAVRMATRTYLVASHLGTAFIFAVFLTLGHAAGSLRFEAFGALGAGAGSALPATLLFAFALVGFGTKAGLVPLHVWLPEAHPAAPSHVSALMSGVLVKMGIYGILRVLSFLPPAPLGHGLALAGVGLLGAVAALLLALGQRDLKRILAYSTVENVGLVAFGLGIGLVGAAARAPAVAALGVAGALLHLWNHALMKGLAFMGAGAVVHGTGTRDVERMGGLLRRLPVSAGLLVFAAAALAALPPLNGFVSEWLLYLGLLQGGRGASAGVALLAYLSLAVLALVGALAAVVFTRLVGAALLGSPRSPEAASAHEGGPLLLAPLAALAAANAAVALFPGQAIALLTPAAALVLRVPEAQLAATLAPAVSALTVPLRVGLAVLVVAGVALALASRRMLSRRDVRAAATWGCGFSAESPRVQYTAASLSELALAAMAPRALQPVATPQRPEGIFPRRVRFALEADDPARARVFEPAFRAVGEWFGRLRRFQQSRLNLQLLYTVLTVLALSALLLFHQRGS